MSFHLKGFRALEANLLPALKPCIQVQPYFRGFSADIKINASLWESIGSFAFSFQLIDSHRLDGHEGLFSKESLAFRTYRL